MQVIKLAQVPKQQATGSLFVGGPVTRQNLTAPQTANCFSIVNVNFARGARNKFHLHSCAQVLIVTGGRGVVATEDQEVVVEPGDVIYIPPGEKHWHGATSDSEFSHIGVGMADLKTTQLED